MGAQLCERRGMALACAGHSRRDRCAAPGIQRNLDVLVTAQAESQRREILRRAEARVLDVATVLFEPVHDELLRLGAGR